MSAYWVYFEEGKPACVEAKSIEAAMEAATAVRGAVKTLGILPYPSVPRIGERSEIPSFCHSPSKCYGHTSCPADRSCTE